MIDPKPRHPIPPRPFVQQQPNPGEAHPTAAPPGGILSTSTAIPNKPTAAPPENASARLVYDYLGNYPSAISGQRARHLWAAVGWPVVSRLAYPPMRSGHAGASRATATATPPQLQASLCTSVLPKHHGPKRTTHGASSPLPGYPTQAQPSQQGGNRRRCLGGPPPPARQREVPWRSGQGGDNSMSQSMLRQASRCN